jgi:hypothetical protein
MLKNNKGYLLAECMMALFLFTAVSMICLPYVYTLYREKETNKQLMYTTEQIDLAVIQISITQTLPKDNKWVHSETEYKLINKKGGEDENTICIQFKGENGKNYEKCSGYTL